MKCLSKHYVINAPAEKVHQALTNPQLIAIWSGSPAEMDVLPMGRFSLWEGAIYGYNRKVTKRKIVQDWYEKTWIRPSFVTFLLKEKDKKTHLELIHEEIPERFFTDIESGWDAYYMMPLIELVEKSV